MIADKQVTIDEIIYEYSKKLLIFQVLFKFC